jgi:hypothetical protein
MGHSVSRRLKCFEVSCSPQWSLPTPCCWQISPTLGSVGSRSPPPTHPLIPSPTRHCAVGTAHTGQGQKGWGEHFSPGRAMAWGHSGVVHLPCMHALSLPVANAAGGWSEAACPPPAPPHTHTSVHAFHFAPAHTLPACLPARLLCLSPPRGCVPAVPRLLWRVCRPMSAHQARAWQWVAHTWTR